MLADMLTTEVFDGGVQSSQCQPDPEWPAILEAFRQLDGRRCSWMTVLSGERQLSIGGGRQGYVVVAEADCQVLKGLHLGEPVDEQLELWLKGSRRDCPSEHLHPADDVLHALKAFVLGGEFSAQILWAGD